MIYILGSKNNFPNILSRYFTKDGITNQLVSNFANVTPADIIIIFHDPSLDDELEMNVNELAKKCDQIFYFLPYNDDKNEHKNHYSGNNVAVIKYPDIIGTGCSVIFEKVFERKSNFIQWPGESFLKHEFIFALDFCKYLGNLVVNNASENLDIKIYTIEQIAAAINELTGIMVKISKSANILKRNPDLENKEISNATELYQGLADIFNGLEN